VLEYQYPHWQPLLQSVLTEFDAKELEKKVIDAEEALVKRLEEIHGGICHDEERRAIGDASHTLLLLREQKLKGPPRKRASAIASKS
jgi:hypothetical protein